MTEWSDTYLHNVAQYGGIEPMGEGPYGGTVWDPLTSPDGNFLSTQLENTPDVTWVVVL